jgi:ankyrin repeat protein
MKKAGAVLSVGDYDNRTPLHVACCEGHSDLVRADGEYVDLEKEN